MTVVLRGITWDHVRGIGGLAATAGAYAERRPDVRVEWTPRSLQAFADQPVEELARRFDLLYLDHPAIGHAVARGCVAALDEQLDAGFLDGQASSSVGRSAESYVWEGHRWALATDSAAQVAAYRPDLMERADAELPRTWDDVLALPDRLRATGLRMAMPSIPVDAACAFLAACVALGEEPLAADDRAVGDATGRAALDLLRAVVSRSHPASLESNPPRLLEHMATEDDVAYCPLAFGYSNYARPGFRPNVVLAAPPPAGDDGTPCGTLGGAGLAVSAFSPALEEAMRYAAFVAQPEVQRGVYFDGGGQPGHRSAWTDDGLNAATNGFFRDTLLALDAAYLRPRHDGFVEFQAVLGDLVHKWLGDPATGDAGSILEAIDRAHRDARAALPAGRS